MLNRAAVEKTLKDTQRENLEKTKKISKDRLTATAEKKMKTVFIGAIDSIEHKLGKFLWGHDKDPRDRTEKELQWLEIWKELREEILNKGNNQLRGLLLEISEYDVVWNKKQLYFDLTGEKNAK